MTGQRGSFSARISFRDSWRFGDRIDVGPPVKLAAWQCRERGSAHDVGVRQHAMNGRRRGAGVLGHPLDRDGRKADLPPCAVVEQVELQIGRQLAHPTGKLMRRGGILVAPLALPGFEMLVPPQQAGARIDIHPELGIFEPLQPAISSNRHPDRTVLADHADGNKIEDMIPHMLLDRAGHPEVL